MVVGFITHEEGFLGSSAVKNPPASGEDIGLIPSLRRSDMLRNNKAHALRQLKPMCLERMLHKKSRDGSEKPASHN